MTKNKQLAAVIVLSFLIAIESLCLTGVPVFTAKEESPAAVFNQNLRPLNLERTLRPDGQTESAELCNSFDLEGDLDCFLNELCQPVFTVDSIYVCPTPQTAKLILKRALRKLENVYVPQAYDCDDNAVELMVLLRKEALVEYREYPAGLAIGFIGLRFDGPIWEYPIGTRDPDDFPFYHAMVVMRLKGGHWLLIEPLTHQVCELTGPIFEGQITIELLYF